MAPLTPAQQSLVTEHLDWAVHTIKWRARDRYPTFHLDPDDMRGMAGLALVTSARRYDPAGGASFRTFAARRVMGCLDDSMRRNGYANATAAPIDDALHGAGTLDVERIEAQAARAHLSAARGTLPPLSRAVIGMLYDQACDLEFAARRLGLSVKEMRDLQRQSLNLLTDKIRGRKNMIGGFRVGAGRPRKSERCACGAMTIRRAEARWHRC